MVGICNAFEFYIFEIELFAELVEETMGHIMLYYYGILLLNNTWIY
jgi:hypothetical protein